MKDQERIKKIDDQANFHTASKLYCYDSKENVNCCKNSCVFLLDNITYFPLIPKVNNKNTRVIEIGDHDVVTNTQTSKKLVFLHLPSRDRIRDLRDDHMKTGEKSTQPNEFRTPSL